MNRLFNSRRSRTRSKQVCCHVSGALLLAMPLTGVFLPTPSAWAQPVVTPSTNKSLKPLSPEQKSAIDKVMATSRWEKVCQKLIDLKVENATLEDVIFRVKAAVPNQVLTIHLRDGLPVRLSFDLHAASIGDVITHASALAGCKLFLFPDGLVVTPASGVSAFELQTIKEGGGGEWSKSTAAGGSEWSSQSRASTLFTRAVAQEITGADADHLPQGITKSTFGAFSPESQGLLQQMAGWLNTSIQRSNPRATPLRLDAASPITVDTSNPDAIMVSFNPGISDPNMPTMAIRDFTQTGNK